MVKVVAHRGFSGRYPESTEIAFRKALELEVDAIEFDVHLAKDESLIVIHDGTVDRTSDGSGSVGEMTLSEIKALDAGSVCRICCDNNFFGPGAAAFQPSSQLCAVRISPTGILDPLWGGESWGRVENEASNRHSCVPQFHGTPHRIAVLGTLSHTYRPRFLMVREDSGKAQKEAPEMGDIAGLLRFLGGTSRWGEEIRPSL